MSKFKVSGSYWQYWLLGKSFLVFTNDKPLEIINVKCKTDEVLGDLTYYLSQNDYHVKYSPGKDNAKADCLSRNPELESYENFTELDEKTSKRMNTSDAIRINCY